MDTDKKLESYSVGILKNPTDKEIFDDLEDAEVQAIQNSIDDDAWGVWDEYTGELLSIAYGSRIYSN